MNNVDVFCYNGLGIKVANILMADGVVNNITCNRNTDQTKDYGGDFRLYLGWEFGKESILPKEVVEKFDCIVAHNGPLPPYRCGSILYHQKKAGEKETVITFFKANAELDAGFFIAKTEPISLEQNVQSLHNEIIYSTAAFGHILSKTYHRIKDDVKPIDVGNNKYYPRIQGEF